MSDTSILTGTTAGFNILEGVFGMSAADAQAGALKSQLSLMRLESEADIARYAEEAKGLKAEQSVRYLKSGVTLEGSPLDILDETVRVSAENISAMRAKTTADILSAKSKISAIRGQGRAALVGGFAKAASVYAGQARKLPSEKTPKTPEISSRGNATGFDEGTYK
jgi:hypothetical protein